MSSRSRSKSRSRSRSRSKSSSRRSNSRGMRVDSVALRACNGLPSADCRQRAFCRWVAANEHKNKKGQMVKFKGHCKKVRKASKSPRRARSPSRCRSILKKSPCKKAVGCAWVKKHAGRGGKMIPSMCRGVRVAKKSPKRVSACASKKMRKCVKSPFCTWAKAYDRKDGKHVDGSCRRRKRSKRSKRRAKSARTPSPNMAAYRTSRTM